MISLAALFLFGWFFFKSVGLAFRVAWCAAKVVAAVLFMVALPLMVVGLLIGSIIKLALPLLRRAVVKPGSAAMEFVKAAAEDAYDRLIYPSLEREMRAALTDRADEGAIGQFALNLKPLLMQPPVKGKVTMGLDPGYRMGCKVAVVDGTGKVLDTAVVYPTYGERQKLSLIHI